MLIVTLSRGYAEVAQDIAPVRRRRSSKMELHGTSLISKKGDQCTSSVQAVFNAA
jgi:hypothetical protein